MGISGLAGVADRLQRLNGQLEGANDRATRNMATALRNSIRGMLRGHIIKPSGELYPSRKLRSVRRIQKSAVQIAQEIEEQRDRTTGKNLTPGEIRYRRDRLRRATLRLSRSLRLKNRRSIHAKHRASAAGQPPAPDVGLLPQAVKAGRTDGELRVGVGGDWKGWAALHEGRGRVRGRRPFMELGLKRVEKDLVNIAVSTLREEEVGRE